MKLNIEKRVLLVFLLGRNIKSILSIAKSIVNCNPNYIKWIPIENIHLTLSFLGNVTNQDFPHLIQSVEKYITSNNFQIKITDTGVFPSFKSPKELCLGISKGIDELTSLQSNVEQSIIE